MLRFVSIVLASAHVIARGDVTINRQFGCASDSLTKVAIPHEAQTVKSFLFQKGTSIWKCADSNQQVLWKDEQYLEGFFNEETIFTTDTHYEIIRLWGASGDLRFPQLKSDSFWGSQFASDKDNIYMTKHRREVFKAAVEGSTTLLGTTIDPVRVLAVSEATQKLAALHDVGVEIFDLQTTASNAKPELWELERDHGMSRKESLAWSPDGQMLAVGTVSGFVFVRQTNDAERFPKPLYIRDSSYLCWLRNGILLGVSRSSPSTAVVFDVKSNQQLASTNIPGSSPVKAFSCAPQADSFVISTGEEASLWTINGLPSYSRITRRLFG